MLLNFIYFLVCFLKSRPSPPPAPQAPPPPFPPPARALLAEFGILYKAKCKRMQQLPTMYGPAVHRGKATIHKPCVISVPNNVGRALQTDPVLLPYTSAITKQKKC